MTVVVNGDQRAVPPTANVADVVAALGLDPSGPGIAVARNGDVVPRRSWADERLAEGDRVEVLVAAAGG